MRVKRLVAAFKQFKDHYNSQFDKPIELRTKMKFKPPKPTMTDGIMDLFELFQNKFQEIEFQEGVSRSFVKTGCVPINQNDGLFVTYVPETQKGSLSFVPLGTRGEADVKSVLLADETTGTSEGPFHVEANEFADLILLDEDDANNDDDNDDDDNDDDENNELIDAAIYEHDNK